MKKRLITQGFTLAEMLVVLLIVSIIAVATVPIAVKRFKQDKIKTYHGKYMCYYDSATGMLAEIEYEKKKVIRENFNLATCTFIPKPEAAYYIVQLIGGGGGGSYAGTLPARVAVPGDGTINIPTSGNGTITTSGIEPYWLSAALTTAAIDLNANIQSAAGNGGKGYIKITLLTEADCITYNAGVIDGSTYCKWTYTNATGGKGGYATNASGTVKAALGSAFTSSIGGPGVATTVSYNSTQIASATGGTSGTDATSAGNGTAGTPLTGVGTPGLGGTGVSVAVNTAGSPPLLSSGISGGSGSAGTVTITPATIPYTSSYATKQLVYGEGGKAGEYKDMIFTKLSSNMTINVGVGGLGGTSGATTGSKGGNTSIGIAGASYAEGGDGGTGDNQTISIDLYKTVYDTGSYISTVLDPYGIVFASNRLSIAGTKGEYGPFVAIEQARTPDDSPITNADLQLLGAGGDGGGSSTCVGFPVSRKLNGVNLTSEYVGDTTCTAGNEQNISETGKQGHSGAVVIVW